MPNASAIPKPLAAPFPKDNGTMTNAKGRVHGRTIMVSPAAKLNKYHPNPTGVSGPKKKNQIKPKTITTKMPRETNTNIFLSAVPISAL